MAIRGVGGGGPVGGGGSEQVTHTVQKGETLDGVAQHYGVSKKDLIKENPLLEGAAKLKVGMQLNIPAGRGGAAAARVRAEDTFEASAKRSFVDPLIAEVKLPKMSGADKAKYAPVTIKDEAAAQKARRGEAGGFKNEAQAFKSGDWKAFGDPHLEGKEAAAFKGEALRPEVAGRFKRQSGEARAFKQSGEAQAFKRSGEAQAYKPQSGEAQAFKQSGEAQAFKQMTPKIKKTKE